MSNFKGSAAAFALLAAMTAPVAAVAERVTLKSADGTVNLVGEFIDFADDNYIIRTPLGDLRIAASRVRCEGAACPTFETATADVSISGSDDIGLGMMPLLMTGFASSMDADAEITNPADNQSLAKLVADAGFGDDIGSFLVSSTSTDAAFEALLNKESQIGMASRRILPEEAKKLRAAGAGNMVSPDQERIIAVDSVVVITNPSNPVQELTVEQLRGIYSGQITNWKELGGEDARITVVARPEDSSSHEFFTNYVFGDAEQTPFLAEAIAEDDQEMSNVVFGNRTAIGYVGYAFQRGAKPVTLVNECGIAVKPDAFSAKTEEYDLSRRMYLYNRSDNLDPATQDFLTFAISEEADGVIAKSGFIDLGVARRAQDLTDSRAVNLAAEAGTFADTYEAGIMREMLGEMTDNDRLSTTFRFRTGSSKMDEKAQADLNRLISYLERMPEGTKVSMVGFTDSVGAFEANRNLSIARADQVRQDVLDAAQGRLDHIQFASMGFGEIAPSACNITDAGKSINRRVEVWISKS